MILIPGFVDCHRHSWEGQLRRINPNSPTLADYSNATHQSFAKAYRPQDMYVGNYLTAVGCIDAGITCVIDNSHNARSAEHSDAAVEALMDSGVRAVHASGAPQAGDWNKQWPQDLERLQKKYFSSADQLVTLRMVGTSGRSGERAAVVTASARSLPSLTRLTMPGGVNVAHAAAPPISAIAPSPALL